MFPYYGYYPYNQSFGYVQPETIYYKGRVFTRNSNAMPHSTWIEKGPDGRGRYVKKKTATPSIRKVFAEAFRDLRQRNQTTNDTGQAQANTSAQPASTTEQTSRQKSSSGANMNNSKNSANAAQNAQNQLQPAHMAYYPGHPQFQAYNPYQYYPPAGTGYNSAAMMPTPYANHMRPFPAVPPGLLQPPAIPANKDSNPHTTMSPQSQAPAIDAPPPGLALTTPTDAAKIAMTQMVMNPDGLKFKCMLCGQFRSSRYHWKHRLAPGQLPGPTICRKCRKHTTESEDETTESEELENIYRSRSVGRRRSRPRGKISRAVSRARSSSRVARRTEDFDFYATNNVYASSSESDDLRRRSVRRPKSRSRRIRAESRFVRYVDDSQPMNRAKSRTRKVIYIQEPDDESESSEEEVEVRYIKQHAENSRVRIRSATPGPRALPPPGLLHEGSQPVYVEQRVYYDEPPASSPDKAIPVVELNSRNRYRQVRSSSRYADTDRMSVYDSGQRAPTLYRVVTRPDQDGGRHRSISRKRTDIHEDLESNRSKNFFTHAPTPPVHMSPDSMSSAQHAGYRRRDERGRMREIERVRSASRGRRRSSNAHEVEEEVAPPDDYNWYDADGMKVRVREI